MGRRQVAAARRHRSGRSSSAPTTAPSAQNRRFSIRTDIGG
jgi:hypothetical protein